MTELIGVHMLTITSHTSQHGVQISLFKPESVQDLFGNSAFCTVALLLPRNFNYDLKRHTYLFTEKKHFFTPLSGM